MHNQKRKKIISKKRKKFNTASSLTSELDSYQPNNPLTKYVEEVCGVNSTDPTKIK
jgi:hypothetical protein